jgi:hypothetical protein
VSRFQGIVKRDTLLQSQKKDKVNLAIGLSKLGKLSDENLFKICDPEGSINFEENKRQLISEAVTKMKIAAAAQALSGATGGKGKGKK